ncbi:MAG: hypothetical protein LPK19_09585, partial [Hymenobacteraceae bacterium]|nr:hypothetical protein [Hymenobacteraceae bacterium]MDX5396475.1 hypothetical protein [Hymenobacteraceae bacterium]MDX5512536.1 hypothetical protein [Hymenobacteraceae bacterium]
YGIWLTPSLAKSINGIAIGIIGPDVPCNMPESATQTSNGLNLQVITNGLFIPLVAIAEAPLSKYYRGYHSDSSIKAEADSILSATTYPSTHNGLELAAFGTTTARVNGVSVSPWASQHISMNGLAVNGIWNVFLKSNGISIAAVNSSLSVKGTQIGIINQTIKLKGLQFGLWNRNEKRSLPLVNWDF